jgi:thiol:disulfide interchange protein DsbD
MSNMKFVKIIIVLILVLSIKTLAQFGSQAEHVKIKTYSSLDKLYAGTENKLALKVSIEDKWHINSNSPYEEFLIPTALNLVKNYKFDFSEKPLSVWQEEIIIGTLVKVKENVKPGIYKLIFNLDYQACNDMSCLAPSSVTDTLQIEIADRKSTVNQINQEVFSNINLETIPPKPESQKSDNSIASKLEQSGIILGLLFIFFGGLALNLTPCVYPLIPITIGYFGGQSEGKTSKLFFMGLLFMLGMAVTYSVVGVVTSLTGAVFGSLLQNPIVILVIVAIFLVLSLSMFGVYEFKLPDNVVARAGGAKGGLFGAFFMGLTMGIVAAPCIGPFVLGLVTYVATKGDPFYGFLMFFVLALGLGLPYLFLAIFSGKIKNLPRAGLWMDAVKHIFGFILIAMALYFLIPLLPKTISGYVLPIFGILSALFLLFFDKAASSVKGFRIFKTVLSILVIAISVYLLIPSEKQGIKWSKYSETSINKLDGKRGVIIDFYADWCIPCKELDAITFSDPKVIELSKDFGTYKADMTKSLSPEVSALREKYKIVGVPTVLILDSKGIERNRITGFLSAEEFYQILFDIR